MREYRGLHLAFEANQSDGPVVRLGGIDPITGGGWMVDLTPFVIEAKVHAEAGKPTLLDLRLTIDAVSGIHKEDSPV